MSLPSRRWPASDAASLAHAFHQVAVADEGPGAVVDDPVARPVERARPGTARRSPCRRRCRRPGPAGRWWSRRPACGRARGARRLRAPLAEVLDVVEREIVAGEVQQASTAASRRGRRRARTGRGRPSRGVAGCAQEAVPEDVGGRRQRHRRAGMAGLGRFDRVHREGADGVDAAPGHRIGRRIGAGGRGVSAAAVGGECSQRSERNSFRGRGTRGQRRSDEDNRVGGVMKDTDRGAWTPGAPRVAPTSCRSIPVAP